MIAEVKHKNENRLSIHFEYDTQKIALIKKISGYEWSQTLKCWHIPNSPESRKLLSELFPKMYMEFEKIKKPIVAKENIPGESVLMFETKQRIVLVLKKNSGDIQFIKTLNYHSYDSVENRWLVTNTSENLSAINQYFGNRLEKLENKTELPTKKAASKIQSSELHIVEYVKGRIKLIFKYNKELISLVKTLPYRSWDDVNGWWTVVNTQEVIDKLESFCKKHEMIVKYFNDSKKVIKGRQLKEQIPNYKKCPQEYIDKLKLLRYSESTINTYSSSFEEFINYYHRKKINDISEPEIIEFTRYLVVERGVSGSYQNQAINAIKFYYEKVLGESRKFYYLDRPKRDKVLPEVLTKEEVKLMINATSNLKHKCIIMLIYSAGLRVSEALNLKVNDIDGKRGMIIIRKGKGNKDRNSLLSNKVLLYLREYYVLHKPKDYLFEGAYGGAYSTTSVLKVVKRAAINAGVRKKVTTHTLRHSFATHLLEQGTDLRYIQGLLGHESSKTTEIYTHITSRGLDEITNPLDDMDL
ncbi:site-specific tyrosine recombinase/integron integrase [Bacteroidota bacterium]